MNSMNGQMGMRGPSGSGIRGQGNVIPKGYKAGQLQQFTPDQMRLFSQLFSHAGPDSYLSRLAGGDESQFEQMEAPAWRLFNQSQGQLASRFSGMGLGARGGSGFANSSNQYASDFAQDLASKRQELQRQAIMDLMGISNSLFGQRPYEKFLTEKPENKTSELVGKLGGFIPGLVSSFMGGGSPGSAAKGALSIFGG